MIPTSFRTKAEVLPAAQEALLGLPALSLPPFSLVLLQLRPPCCFSNTSGSVLLQDLCTPSRSARVKARSSHLVSGSYGHMQLVPAEPGSLVLVQFLAFVLYRGPATAGLLGRVDQLLAVSGPGAG